MILAFFTWWLIIQLFGLAALPSLRRVFAWLPDQGYAFAKTAGLLLVSYLLWLGASAGILANNLAGIQSALFVTALFSILSSRPWVNFPARLGALWRKERWNILIVEALFLLSFAGWAAVRGYAPARILPVNGEKYMEIAFLNGVLNSAHFPPLDPWMAGESISYYYFGYVMMGVITRQSGVAATVGFDLYDALLFALTAACAYGVVSNLVRASGGKWGASGAAGILAALFTVGMGNLEGLLEGLYSARVFPAAFWKWIDIPGLTQSTQSGFFYPGNGWWWWRASRVLHDLDLAGRPAVYQPIDEFPFFSFLLGDNHPHKLALPFVLLAAGLALNLLLGAAGRKAASPAGPRAASRRPAWLHPGEAGRFLFTALALGGLAFLNTWDFPVYLGLAVLAWAAGSALSRTTSRRQLLADALGLFTALGSVSLLLYSPFFTGFRSQAGGILPYALAPTRLAQYLVMFGPFIFLLACFFALALRRADGQAAAGHLLRAWLWIAGLLSGAYLLVIVLASVFLNVSGLRDSSLLQPFLDMSGLAESPGIILAARLANPWHFLALTLLAALAITAILALLKTPVPVDGPNTAALFALLLGLAGLALTLLVDFIYLRDNFGLRINSVFKFYYQGWVLMALAGAYAAWWVGQHLKPVGRVIFGACVLLFTAAGLVYPVIGILSRTEQFRGPAILDAAATFAGLYPEQGYSHPDDWAAIQWLLNHGRLPDGAPPVIVEAGADGYENAGRISAFTGFPTLLGWTNHELQWRGNSKEIDARKPDLQAIFTTPSAQTALALLRKWNVRYVIIGEIERQYVTNLCSQPGKSCDPRRGIEKFNEFLTPVFTQGRTTIYQLPAVP